MLMAYGIMRTTRTKSNLYVKVKVHGNRKST